MPVGFGAKSGLNAWALLHPGTHPGSAAPRSPLARSWPQKCQFCSNLGLKGVSGSGGKRWRREIWKQPCVVRVSHLWKHRRTAESKGWSSWGDKWGDKRGQTPANTGETGRQRAKARAPIRSCCEAGSRLTLIRCQGGNGMSHCPAPSPAGDRDGRRDTPKLGGASWVLPITQGLRRMRERGGKKPHNSC